jgi:cyclase
MITGIRDRVAPMVKKGMTADQVAAAKPTADYDAKMGDTGTTGARFVGQLYAELGGK